jgi:hypothetical protein
MRYGYMFFCRYLLVYSPFSRSKSNGAPAGLLQLHAAAALRRMGTVVRSAQLPELRSIFHMPFY